MATKLIRALNTSTGVLLFRRCIGKESYGRLNRKVNVGYSPVQVVRCLTTGGQLLPIISRQKSRFMHGGAPPASTIVTQLSDVEYNKIADETLESLAEFLEELSDSVAVGGEFDVSFANGVVTLTLSSSFGTYVINKQSPNKQIWLSSPRSGPKRYDFVNGAWIYKHEGRSLHDLLTEEIREALCSDVDFTTCQHGGSSG